MENQYNMNVLKPGLKLRKLNLKKAIGIAALLIIVFSALGCTKSGEVSQTGKGNDDMAFSVNGQKISIVDFRKRLFKARYVQEAQGIRYQGTGDSEMYQTLRDNTINLMVQETTIMQEAEKAGVSVPEAEVDKVIQSIKSNFPSEEEFKAVMLSRGLDEETMKNYNRMQLTGVALVQKLGSEQAYNELLNSAVSRAKIEKNDKVIAGVVDEVSKITSEQLLSDPGSAI